jgi:hypothetical protein
LTQSQGQMGGADEFRMRPCPSAQSEPLLLRLFGSRGLPRRLTFGLPGLLLAAIALASCGTESPAGGQPVAYNHKVHVQQEEIPCTDCHEGAETRARAGFPTDDFCQACHSSAIGESENEARLVELLDAQVPLAWHQVTKVADHVYFSHRRHVALGNVDCSTCHGNMREKTIPISRPEVSFEHRAGMFRCMECHQKSGSPHTGIDCMDCHR